MGGRRDGSARPRGGRIGALAPLVLVGLVAAAAVGSGLRRGGAPTPPHGGSTPYPVASTQTAALRNDLSSVPPPAAGRFRGRLAIATGDGCRMETLDLRTLAEGTLSTEPLCNAVFSPNGRYVLGQLPADVEDAGPLVLHDLVAHRARRVTDSGDGLTAMAVADDGTVAVCIGLDEVRIVTADGGRRQTSGCDPAFAGRRLLVTRGDRIVDAATGAVVARAPGGAEREIGAGATPDGRLLVTYRRDAVGPVLVLRETRTGRVHRRLRYTPVGRILAVRVARGAAVAAVEAQYTWELVRLSDGAVTRTLGGEIIYDLSFSPDGRRFVAWTSRHLVLGDTALGAPLAALPILGGGRVTWLPAAA